MDFLHWWLTWRRLGNECDLRQTDWNHQFNACMNHQGYFTKYLQEIIEHEVCENTTWDLERRYAFISNKLVIAFKAQETLQNVNPPEGSNRWQQQPRSPTTCFKCGQRGHMQAKCPKNRHNFTCFNCGDHGHFASECRRPRREQHQHAQGPRGPPPPSAHVKAGGGYPKQPVASPAPFHPGKSGGYGGRGPQPPAQYAHASKPLSREELQRRRDNGLCLHCAKPGHQQWECPVKKSQHERGKGSSQRQVHVSKGSKGSKGSSSKGRASGKGKSGGRKGGHGRIRELDAYEYADDDFDTYEYYDDYDYYEDYQHDEESVTPPEGAPVHPS